MAVELVFLVIGSLGLAAIPGVAPRVGKTRRQWVYVVGGGWLLAFGLVGPLVATGELFFGVVEVAGEVFALAAMISAMESQLRQRDVDDSDEAEDRTTGTKQASGW